jgi:hypothetical protein
MTCEIWFRIGWAVQAARRHCWRRLVQDIMILMNLLCGAATGETPKPVTVL